ncbi:MAG: SDR family oxidoreductase [Deltaproteobacteria bacterium]|nr:MAG: SDR family oxidoreductase [Deltaproteobacteria bacterium]
MELNLSGKKALITGSSRGIGLAIAQLLQKEGCLICLNGRDSKNLEVAMTHLKGAVSSVGDMTSPDEAKHVVSEAFEKLGKIDILICNVGSGSSVPPGKETYEEWQRVLAINFLSTTNTVEAAREVLSVSQGVIVCISSICGIEVVAGAPITYSVAKAALNAYVKGISRPLGKQGIRINAVAPGNVLFEGSVWERKLSDDKELVQSMLERDVALARLGAPHDVANLVAYLASPLANFATGVIWTVDGGQVHS